MTYQISKRARRASFVHGVVRAQRIGVLRAEMLGDLGSHNGVAGICSAWTSRSTPTPLSGVFWQLPRR